MPAHSLPGLLINSSKHTLRNLMTFINRGCLMLGKLGRLLHRRKELMTCYTVIIVSDDPEATTHLRSILETGHYVVFTASTAGEVLPYLDRMLPDVLVCDFAQPEITGRALLDTIRIRLGKTTMPPIVFLRDNPDDEELANFFGADDLLLKPFTPEALLACVGRLTIPTQSLVAKRAGAAVARV